MRIGAFLSNTIPYSIRIYATAWKTAIMKGLFTAIEDHRPTTTMYLSGMKTMGNAPRNAIKREFKVRSVFSLDFQKKHCSII